MAELNGVQVGRMRNPSFGDFGMRNGKFVISAVVAFLIAAALPVTVSTPVYPATYGYTPAYEPTYTPTYDYQPVYNPAPTYDPPYYSPAPYVAPAYNPPPYNPAPYTPPYNPAPYTPPYNPPYYSPAPYYPTPQYYQEYDNYDAITYQELNISTHCGVVPVSNDDFYAGTDISPFGKYPFVVVIEDDYYNFVCQGVMVHWRYVLTSSSCIYGSTDKYRVRFGDWDLLTNYNEYEPYKNFNTRICNSWPVSYDSSSGSYSYGGSYSELVLLEVDFPEHVSDKYPHVSHICLPTYYQSYYTPQYTPTYNPQPYSPPTPSYGYTPPYSPPAASYGYNPPAPTYTPTYNPAPTYDYYPSECYVVGWYASPSTQLENHPAGQEVQEVYAPAPAPQYGGYGYPSPQYTPPTYTPVYKAPYYQEYYQGYDQSKIPKKATVKEIKCPYSSGYGGNPQPQGYGYSSYQDEEVCFVGVYGSDACVADKGAAIFCLVPEKYSGYDAGYNNYDTSYQSTYGYGYQPTPYSASYPPYDSSSYYPKNIQVNAAQQKPTRQRAVLYAIVQKTTTCSDYSSSYSYGYNQPQQSKPITATKHQRRTTLNHSTVINPSTPHHRTMNLIFTPNYPTPTYEPQYSPPPYYPTPTYEPQYSPPPYYPTPTYEPQYSPPPYYPTPTYEPQYSPPPYYPTPTYEPQYSPPPYYPTPTYEPQYSSPPYYAPTYDYQPAPTYNPPAPYYSG
ncbi:hypothetical protein Ocin01_12178 [Orchesella cincta]|uniref:Peptidase S1 domain-containing protein n=1 Tax=Orchesella cincta TaxID=48709 RepID=A0A1D2MNR9_ORCCI|nr:hypothetical protein Ocin01_12178 [Orchesella cincta]